jgi:peptidoglycan/xylan/chitin deacetylase (PgdA/CDA1 family)
MLLQRFLVLSTFAMISAGPALTQQPGQALSPAPEANKPAAPAEPHITFNIVNVDGPYIAMTFDDGPSDKLTPRLLKLLAAHHIHATFFVIGQNVIEHPEIVRQAFREGHEIGNHSWSHPNFAKLSDEKARAELQKTDDAIKEATGARPTLFRPPYGSLTARQKKWIHDQFGYHIFVWDFDTVVCKRPGPTVVTNRITKETRAGSIVLSHDIHPGTIDAMPATLDQLETKGFKFVTVSELIEMERPPTPKPSPSQAHASTRSTTASPAPKSTNTGAPHD